MIEHAGASAPAAAMEDVPADKMAMFSEMLKMRREVQTLTEALAREHGGSGRSPGSGSPQAGGGGGWLGKARDLPASAVQGIIRSTGGAAGSRFLGSCEA